MINKSNILLYLYIWIIETKMRILLKGEWLSFNVVTYDTNIKFKGSYKNESYIANTISEIVDYFSKGRVSIIDDVFMDIYND